MSLNLSFENKNIYVQDVYYYIADIHNSNQINENENFYCQIEISSKDSSFTLSTIENYFSKKLNIGKEDDNLYFIKLHNGWNRIDKYKKYINYYDYQNNKELMKDLTINNKDYVIINNKKSNSVNSLNDDHIRPIKILILSNFYMKKIEKLSNKIVETLKNGLSSEKYSYFFENKLESKQYNQALSTKDNEFLYENQQQTGILKQITNIRTDNINNDSLDILFMYSNPLIDKTTNRQGYFNSRILNTDKELIKLIDSIRNYKIKIKLVVADELGCDETYKIPKIFHISCHGIVKREGEFFLCFENEGKLTEVTSEILQGYLGLINLQDTQSQLNFKSKLSYTDLIPNLNSDVIGMGIVGDIKETNIDEEINENTLNRLSKLRSKQKNSNETACFNIFEKSNCLKNFNFNSELLNGSNSSTQVAVVAACHSENIGQAFFNLGILCVICIHSSASVLDDAAIYFTSNFYKFLIQGFSVKQAFDKAIEYVRMNLKEDLFPCCCNHDHKNNCKAKNDHQLHFKYCTCKELKYNEHYKNCDLGKNLREKFNSRQDPNSLYINACCCSPEFPHDESKKFILLYKDKREEYGNLKLYQKINLDNENKSQIVINGRFFINRPDFEVFYVPYLIGRCEDVYKAVEYIYESDNSIIKIFNKRLITFVSNRGVGKTVVSKLVARYLWERKRFSNILYIKKETYESANDLEEKITKFLEVDLFSKTNEDAFHKLSSDTYLIIIEISFNTISKPNYDNILRILLLCSSIWVFAIAEESFKFKYEYLIQIEPLKENYVDDYFRNLLTKEKYIKIKTNNQYDSLTKVVKGNLWLIENAVSLLMNNETIENTIHKIIEKANYYCNEDLDFLIREIISKNKRIFTLISLVPYGITVLLFKIIVKSENLDMNIINELQAMKIITNFSNYPDDIILPLKDKDKMIDHLDYIDVEILEDVLLILLQKYKKYLINYIKFSNESYYPSINEFSLRSKYGIWKKFDNPKGETLKNKVNDQEIKDKDMFIQRIIDNSLFIIMKLFINSSLFLVKEFKYKIFVYISDVILAISYLLLLKTPINNNTITSLNEINEVLNKNFPFYKQYYYRYIIQYSSIRLEKINDRIIKELQDEVNNKGDIFMKLVLYEMYMYELVLLVSPYENLIYKIENESNDNTNDNNIDNEKKEVKYGIFKINNEILRKIDETNERINKIEYDINNCEIEYMSSIVSRGNSISANNNNVKKNVNIINQNNQTRNSIRNSIYNIPTNEYILLKMTKNKFDCFYLNLLIISLCYNHERIKKELKEYSFIKNKLKSLFLSFSSGTTTQNEYFLIWTLEKFVFIFDVSDEETRKDSNIFLNSFDKVIPTSCRHQSLTRKFRLLQNRINEKLEAFKQNIIRIFYSNPLIYIKNDDCSVLNYDSNTINPIQENKIINFNPGQLLYKYLESNQCSKRVSIYEHILNEDSFKNFFTQNGKIAIIYSEDQLNLENFWFEHYEKKYAFGSAKKYNSRMLQSCFNKINITYDFVIITSPNGNKLLNDMKLNKNLNIKYFLMFKFNYSLLETFEFSYNQSYNHLIHQFIMEFCFEIVKIDEYYQEYYVKNMNQNEGNKEIAEGEGKAYEDCLKTIIENSKNKFIGCIAQYIENLSLDIKNETTSERFDLSKICEVILIPKSKYVKIEPYDEGKPINKIVEPIIIYGNNIEVDKIKSDILFRKIEMSIFIKTCMAVELSFINNQKYYPITNIYGVKGCGKSNFIYNTLNYLITRETTSAKAIGIIYISLLDISSMSSFHDLISSITIPHIRNKHIGKDEKFPYDLIIVLLKTDDCISKEDYLFNKILSKLLFIYQNEKKLRTKIIFLSNKQQSLQIDNIQIQYFNLLLWNEKELTKYSEKFLFSKLKLPSKIKHSKSTLEEIIEKLSVFIKSLPSPTPKNIITLAQVKGNKIINDLFNKRLNQNNYHLDLAKNNISKSYVGISDHMRFTLLMNTQNRRNSVFPIKEEEDDIKNNKILTKTGTFKSPKRKISDCQFYINEDISIKEEYLDLNTRPYNQNQSKNVYRKESENPFKEVPTHEKEGRLTLLKSCSVDSPNEINIHDCSLYNNKYLSEYPIHKDIPFEKITLDKVDEDYDEYTESFITNKQKKSFSSPNNNNNLKNLGDITRNDKFIPFEIKGNSEKIDNNHENLFYDDSPYKRKFNNTFIPKESNEMLDSSKKLDGKSTMKIFTNIK